MQPTKLPRYTSRHTVRCRRQIPVLCEMYVTYMSSDDSQCEAAVMPSIDEIRIRILLRLSQTVLLHFDDAADACFLAALSGGLVGRLPTLHRAYHWSRDSMIIRLKRALYITFAIVLLAFAGVGLQSYLNGVLAPPYDQDAMTLNYERIGDGPNKIVLLHGLTGSLKYWKMGLDEAPDSYSLLLIDLLGFGESPKPNDTYTLEQHLGAIEKVLRIEGFDSGESFAVGHSMGAILAIGLVAKHPDWFDGLAVIGLPNFVDGESIRNGFAKLSLWDELTVDSRFEFICFFHPLYMAEWFRPKNLPQDIFEDARKHTWVSYYNSLDEIIVKTDLRQLVSPIGDIRILLIHGENDVSAPIENVAALLPAFGNAQFERLAGADHQVYLAAPARVWKLIEEFRGNGVATTAIALRSRVLVHERLD